MRLFSLIRQRYHPLHKLRRSGLFRAAVRYCDPAFPVKLPGFHRRIYLRFITHSAIVLAGESVEPGIRRTFATILEHAGEGAFWDIGANIGLFTFTCAELSPDRQIVSVEPDEHNLACLRRTSANWKLEKHAIYMGALGERDGEATFHIDDASGATGSINQPENSFSRRHFGARQRTATVPIRKLDTLVADLRAPPKILKIDVEGAELSVLRGAHGVIAQHLPTILLETFENAAECDELLQSFGYAGFDSDRLSHRRPDTTNFLYVHCDSAPPALLTALAQLGYPKLQPGVAR